MVELYVSEILARASGDRTYIMMLQEKDGMRKLPVLIGPLEATAVAFVKKNANGGQSLMTHDLFRNFSMACGYALKCATIYKIEEGTFYSNLLFDSGEAMVKIEARISDAVAVAMRCDAPIYIEDELLNMLCIKEEWENAFSIPITLAGTDTLREVMERAVKDENYELAMKLKKEIDARMERRSASTEKGTPEEDGN